MKTDSPSKSARRAGLHYVSSDGRGIRRVPVGRGFRYLAANGARLRSTKTLHRIRKLVIPPAWRQVWICSSARGHLQATGRDRKGRKQYLYHPQWRAVRDENKYDRLKEFARALPAIRRQVRRDLRTQGLGREKVLATIVRLLDLSAVRIGNDAYAKDGKSYGLTTLQNRHAQVNGAKIQLRFRGKSGKHHAVSINHPQLSRIVKRCQHLPGQNLFEYLDSDQRAVQVTSGDVNDYLMKITGADFTSKDFRTWTGTVTAAVALRESSRETAGRSSRVNLLRAVEKVAKRLGNTPAVCRKCYIHPLIFDSYQNGRLAKMLRQKAKPGRCRVERGLKPEEAAVFRLLRLGAT